MTTDTKPTLSDPAAGYAAPAERPPFAGRALLTGIFNAGFAAAIVAARRSGRELPERVDARDMVLFGVAGHKISRLVTKSKVTAFARAPFTEYEGPGAPSEVEERPRGTGVRRAVAELLVCPYCLSLWLVAGLHVSALFAPRATRLVASVFGAQTISDFLQVGYKAAEKRGLEG